MRRPAWSRTRRAVATCEFGDELLDPCRSGAAAAATRHLRPGLIGGRWRARTADLLLVRVPGSLFSPRRRCAPSSPRRTRPGCDDLRFLDRFLDGPSPGEVRAVASRREPDTGFYSSCRRLDVDPRCAQSVVRLARHLRAERTTSRRNSRTQHLDRARDARCVGQLGVGREKDTVERLGQRDIGSVVSGEVVAQLPTACQQRSMRCSLHR